MYNLPFLGLFIYVLSAFRGIEFEATGIYAPLHLFGFLHKTDDERHLKFASPSRSDNPILAAENPFFLKSEHLLCVSVSAEAFVYFIYATQDVPFRFQGNDALITVSYYDFISKKLSPPKF